MSHSTNALSTTLCTVTWNLDRQITARPGPRQIIPEIYVVLHFATRLKESFMESLKEEEEDQCPGCPDLAPSRKKAFFASIRPALRNPNIWFAILFVILFVAAFALFPYTP